MLLKMMLIQCEYGQAVFSSVPQCFPPKLALILVFLYLYQVLCCFNWIRAALHNEGWL